ncbi:MAG: histidine kinase N-terminal 7TM domain-containing protein [Anaerolineales bacterium]
MFWELTSYSIILAVSAAICVGLAFLSWRWRETPGAFALSFLMLAIAQWGLLVAFENAAVRESQKILWSKLSYIGIAASPVLLLVFVLRYTRQDEVVSPRFFASLWVIPVLTLALVLTNDWHHLIWTRVGVHLDPARNVLLYEYGLWFWFWTAYAYCLLVAATFFLVRMILRYRHIYRLQAALLLLAILFSWLGNVLYMADVGLLAGRDLTPLSFALAATLLFLNIHRFRLLDLVPIAREAVIENMEEGVLVVDRENRIVDANPAALELLGLDPSSIGKKVEEALSAWPELVDVYRDETELRCEVCHEGASCHYLNACLSRLHDGRGRFRGRLVVVNDITAQKLLEEQLRQAQKMEAVGRLAGGIAHEFNNLLTVINGYAEMSLTSLDKGDPIREDLEQVLEAGRRAARLTGRLLTFSRRRSMEVEVVDPRDVLTDIHHMLEPVVDKDVRLETEIAEALGKIKVDRGRLQEALLNLVTNAQDAIGEKNDGEGVVTIGARNVDFATPVKGYLPVERGEYVLMEVRDTGVGMGADIQERIFEPFFTTKEVGDGTGLGMAIVYGTVEAFGGGIEVDSAPGRGTSVRIYIPRVG